MTTSLYIHIPFCASRCNYCSFNSYAGLEKLRERYVESLCVELAQNASRGLLEPLRTVFLGGGTPSILATGLLKKLLASCFAYFPVHPDVEISIEANPGTVDRAKFELLKTAGVNRISIGVQSFNDQELGKTGRIHSAKEAVQAVRMAQDAGFNNISIDLMYGLPGQDPESWQISLGTALSLDINHLSLYQLTVEEHTPLERMVQDGRLQLPAEDELAAMDEITAELTVESGMCQYEISNYARSGCQCQHNITYWKNREYYGVGAGAVSCLRGSRRRNIAAPEEYCGLIESGRSTIIDEETLDLEASFRETVIMGLRMNRGVAVKELEKRYKIQLANHYGKVLRQLIRDKLLEQTEDYLYLTDRGRIFANLVMAELV